MQVPSATNQGQPSRYYILMTAYEPFVVEGTAERTGCKTQINSQI